MAKMIGDRISTEDHSGSTTIVIFPLRKKFREMMLFAWVLSFTFIGCYVMYVLISGVENINVPGSVTEEDLQNQKIYLIVFIGFWAYFEFKTVRALLWYRYGKELIKIDKEALYVKRSVLSYGKQRRYFFENIKDFHQHIQEATSFSHFFENAYWTVGSDSVRFKHFEKNHSFGRKLEEKDTRLLMRFIADRIKKHAKHKVKIVS